MIMTILLSPYIMSHKFNGVYNNNHVTVKGSYDVNIWYSYEYDSKTAVTTKRIDYEEEIEIAKDEETNTSNDIIVRSIKQPNCIEANNDGNSIKIVIEKEEVAKKVFDVIKKYDISKYVIEEASLEEIFIDKVGETYEK